MSSPLFSIIMPTYNRSAVMRPVIEAILSQSITDFELIIVDDGSTDNSLEILNSYTDARVKVLSQDNNRQTQARRMACLEATGKYFAFCDSDDIWNIDYLKCILSVFTDHAADYVFTNYTVEGENKERIDLATQKTKSWLLNNVNEVEKNLYHFDDLYSSLMEYQPIFCSCQAITSEHYKSIGGISEKINNKKLGTVQTSEDSHIIRRSAITNKAYFINKILVTLGRQGDNTSHSYTSNLKGGLNILVDISNNYSLSTDHHNLTKQSISSHRIELCKQIYYYESASTYVSHYMSEPKLTLSLKNHAHFLYALGKSIFK